MAVPRSPIIQTLAVLTPPLAYALWLIAAEALWSGGTPVLLQYSMLFACAASAGFSPIRKLARPGWRRAALVMAMIAAWLIVLFVWTFLFVFFVRGDAL